ncbi:MAG: ROK family transcriptional regulator [Anaerolineaceae bacterium]
MEAIIWPNHEIHVKTFNKHAVLDLIRFTPGGITRIELAKRLGLTRAAITTIINDFIKSGIVRDAGLYSNGSRRRVPLEIVPSLGFVVGVDMGATHILAVVSDFSSSVIREKEIRIDIAKGPIRCLDQMDKLVQQVIAESGIQLKKVLSIGVGVPGPVVNNRGAVSSPPIMPGWDDFPIRKTLEEKWGCPVILNNDAELGALGEWAYGVGRGEENLAYIKVGTGIGAGLMFSNNIYHGVTGTAGEIGHITIVDNGPICTCGNRGCLEALAGGSAIVKRAQEELNKGKKSQLIGLGDLYQFTTNDIISAARKGDILSQQLLDEAGNYLGTAIAGLVNLFNPSMVVIGGGLSQSGDLLLNPIRTTVLNRSLSVAAKTVKISASLLGRRASAMGAVVQAISKSLHKLSE